MAVAVLMLRSYFVEYRVWYNERAIRAPQSVVGQVWNVRTTRGVISLVWLREKHEQFRDFDGAVVEPRFSNENMGWHFRSAESPGSPDHARYGFRYFRDHLIEHDQSAAWLDLGVSAKIVETDHLNLVFPLWCLVLLFGLPLALQFIAWVRRRRERGKRGFDIEMQEG